MLLKLVHTMNHFNYKKIHSNKMEVSLLYSIQR